MTSYNTNSALIQREIYSIWNLKKRICAVCDAKTTEQYIDYYLPVMIKDLRMLRLNYDITSDEMYNKFVSIKTEKYKIYEQMFLNKQLERNMRAYDCKQMHIYSTFVTSKIQVLNDAVIIMMNEGYDKKYYTYDLVVKLGTEFKKDMTNDGLIAFWRKYENIVIRIQRDLGNYCVKITEQIESDRVPPELPSVFDIINQIDSKNAFGPNALEFITAALMNINNKPFDQSTYW